MPSPAQRQSSDPKSPSGIKVTYNKWWLQKQCYSFINTIYHALPCHFARGGQSWPNQLQHFESLHQSQVVAALNIRNSHKCLVANRVCIISKSNLNSDANTERKSLRSETKSNFCEFSKIFTFFGSPNM